ncbi:MAG TPA: serine hydrolase [Chthonomonadales bacterium]|nr:serine hydrolase [Chthonomonadales bacterium]
MEHTANENLPRSSPEQVGVSPEAILGFIDAVNTAVGGLHSFMLLRHGQVAAEAWWAPYRPNYPHQLFSLSKSFTCTAVGLAIQEGKLSLEDRLVSYWPDDVPESVSDNLAAMRIKDLLCMGAGHATDTTGAIQRAADGNWVKAFLALPVEFLPGTHFVYNSGATYMLSATVQRVTGQTVLDYLRPRLFEPLHITGATWDKSPQGIDCGGWGLNIKTEDIAKFGQLYLQNGEWGGRQLVPKNWVHLATQKHISNGDGGASDWTQGYGYQFWRCRHNAYRGDGAFGQYCIIVPDLDAVIAITSGVKDMQAVLNCVWERLLPGIGERTGSHRKESELIRALARQQVPFASGSATSPQTESISDRPFIFEPNDQGIKSISLHFRSNRCDVRLAADGGEAAFSCGSERWVRGTGRTYGHAEPVAARGAWTASNQYTMTLCFYRTPFVKTLVLDFSPGRVTLKRSVNVSFGATDYAPISGVQAG